MEHDKQCILVIIGADQWGRKELLAIADGYRESAQSWRELLLDLKRRGLEVAPELAVGDGALGFWKAVRESHGTTREQRCWLHKTGNVLNKLPKSLQAKAKGHLQDIWLAETKDRAEKAFDFFLEAYGAKYDKATACLAKDRAVLLTFYDFPAEHWKHLRTTNPIESTFATVRLRTIKTKGCLSRTTALTMVFKLCQSAARKWRRLDGSHRLAEIVEGVKFKDGEKLTERAARKPPSPTFDNSSADDQQVHRPTPRRPWGHPLSEPPPGQRRQPLLRGAVQDPEVSPRLPWPLRRHYRRHRLLPVVLPLVQHRAPPCRDRDAHPR